MLRATQLADAIVAYLSGKSFAAGATVARKRIVSTSLEGMTGTRVTVIPFGPSFDLLAVGVADVTLDIRIVVQRSLGGSEEAADEAAELVDAICESLIGETLEGGECNSVKASPSYDPHTMATLDVFDAIILTTWKTIEDGMSD